VAASKEIGPAAAFHYFLNRMWLAAGRSSAALSLQPKGVRYPIMLRGGTSSDEAVFRQIFIEQEYRPLYGTADVKSVLDLGANIGVSAIALLTSFPNARVVAVEPDPENHRLCSQNLAAYGTRAQAILGAVWSHTTKLDLTRVGDCREWAVTVIEASEASKGIIQAWDMASVFAMAGFETVDLLKIDIERSEIPVFSSNSMAWLNRVRNLCIELHGPDCEEAFFGAMSRFEYDLERSGELVICRNIRLRRDSQTLCD
jgi:FkbM family methyltransferase